VRRAPTMPAQITDQPEEQIGFIQKNKMPLLIGAGVLVVGGGIYYVVKQSKKKDKTKSVDGVPRDTKGRFKNRGKSKSKSSRPKMRKKTSKLVPTALL
ncbi:MAG: hypothetical protein WBH03_02930, partial [Cyclobacteriaceae bacterium]